MRVIDFPKKSVLENVRFVPPNFDAGEKAKTKAFGNSMVTVPGASVAKRKGNHHVEVGPTKKKMTPNKDTVDKEVQWEEGKKVGPQKPSAASKVANSEAPKTAYANDMPSSPSRPRSPVREATSRISSIYKLFGLDQWLKEGDLAIDAESLKEMASHVVPPTVCAEFEKLTDSEASLLDSQISVLRFALSCDRLKRYGKQEEMIRTVSRAANENEAKMKMWRDKAEKLEEKLKLANESRIKSDAKMILLQEQVDNLKAEKALLADKDERLQDRFKELQVCLAATQNEIAQHCVASGDVNKEIEKDHVPGIGKTTMMSSQVIAEPFMELLRVVQEVEGGKGG